MTPTAAGASERYSRQARFWAIGAEGQARIAAAHVVVIGCGALGSAAIDLFARSGVGRITAVDRDIVELSNLQRQLLYDEQDAAEGAPKAVAAARAVARINGAVEVRPIVADVTPDNVEAIVAGADVVVDGTDNLETRYLLNDACVKAGIPWVYGGAVGSTGMTATLVPGETPCFRCLFPEPPPAGSMETCETAGVLASGVVIVAATQWTEVVKLLLGDRDNRQRGIMAFDVWTNDRFDAEGAPRRPDCPCCAGRRFEFLEARRTTRTATLCGRDAVQVSPAAPVSLDLAELGRRLEGTGPVVVTGHLVRYTTGTHELTVFADGRAIIKGTDDVALARTLYARFVGA